MEKLTFKQKVAIICAIAFNILNCQSSFAHGHNIMLPHLHIDVYNLWHIGNDTHNIVHNNAFVSEITPYLIDTVMKTNLPIIATGYLLSLAVLSLLCFTFISTNVLIANQKQDTPKLAHSITKSMLQYFKTKKQRDEQFNLAEAIVAMEAKKDIELLIEQVRHSLYDTTNHNLNSKTSDAIKADVQQSGNEIDLKLREQTSIIYEQVGIRCSKIAQEKGANKQLIKDFMYAGKTLSKTIRVPSKDGNSPKDICYDKSYSYSEYFKISARNNGKPIVQQALVTMNTNLASLQKNIEDTIVELIRNSAKKPYEQLTNTEQSIIFQAEASIDKISHDIFEIILHTCEEHFIEFTSLYTNKNMFTKTQELMLFDIYLEIQSTLTMLIPVIAGILILDSGEILADESDEQTTKEFMKVANTLANNAVAIEHIK